MNAAMPQRMTAIFNVDDRVTPDMLHAWLDLYFGPYNVHGIHAAEVYGKDLTEPGVEARGFRPLAVAGAPASHVDSDAPTATLATLTMSDEERTYLITMFRTHTSDLYVTAKTIRDRTRAAAEAVLALVKVRDLTPHARRLHRALLAKLKEG